MELVRGDDNETGLKEREKEYKSKSTSAFHINAVLSL